MGIAFNLASFPNTRIRPRPATRRAETFGGLAPVGIPVLAKAANRARTYLTIRNTNLSSDMAYGYGDQANDSNYLTNEGMILRPGDSMDIESLEDVYVMSIGATPVEFREDEGEG